MHHTAPLISSLLSLSLARYAPGYALLARALAQQEEREQAAGALRTLCRLQPGDHRPVVLLAKELVSPSIS